MKIGAYQFSVTGSIDKNMESICKAVSLAAEGSVRLLVFPECALTGYPIRDERSSDVDFHSLEICFEKLQKLSSQYAVYLLVGSVTKEKGIYRNSAILFSPGGSEPAFYHKRALWGWDIKNFAEGSNGGIWTVDRVKLGVRICFEVRFPEYFRELYREKAGLVFVMFNDTSETDDIERYELIKAHLKTRAAENVCPVISVNSASPYQTAPTAVIDDNGIVAAELPRNTEGLLLYEYQTPETSYGAEGRKALSNRLTKQP